MKTGTAFLAVMCLAQTPLLSAAADNDVFQQNRRLGRGINLGNALEAPKEGDWGMNLKAEYFQKIKDAGFNSVRIPIRWSAHAKTTAPFTIAPEFFNRIEWAIEQGLSRKLAVVINFHHYEEMDARPDKELPRFSSLWKQVANHYRKYPTQLFFELLNEPHDKLTDERWQEIFPKLLASVRESNPERTVIIGSGHWNNVDHLKNLRLPESDRHLIATFHYYSPFKFTHQGASWAAGSKKWLGTTWTGSDQEMQALRHDFDKAAAWSRQHARPIYLGEFGSFSAADMKSRARWTKAIVGETEKRGFSWSYWEFGAGFGAYNRDAHVWRAPLLDALMHR